MNEPLRIDVVGGGGVALAFAKAVLQSEISDQISELVIWKKTGGRSATDLGFDSSLFEDALRMFQLFELRDRPSSGSMELRVQYYESISELRAIATESRGRGKTGEHSLLLLLTRYRLNELFDGKERWCELGEDTRAKAEAVFDLSFPSSSPAVAARLRQESFARFRREYMLAGTKLSEFSAASRIVPQRIFRLKDSVPAMAELGRNLRGYQGTVINFVNEVETTSKILADASSIPPEKIIAPCQHDANRVAYALRRMLEDEKDGLAVECTVLGPHNNLALVPESQITIDGQPLAASPYRQQVRAALDRTITWATLYGQRQYQARGTSDGDTVNALTLALESLLLPDGEQRFRAICYYQPEGVFTGLVGGFDAKGAFRCDADQVQGLSAVELKRFERSLTEQRALDRLCSEVLQR